MGEEGSTKNLSHQDALHFLRLVITFWIYPIGYPNTLLPQFTISGAIDQENAMGLAMNSVDDSSYPGIRMAKEAIVRGKWKCGTYKMAVGYRPRRIWAQ
jgi:hypothetical protein